MLKKTILKTFTMFIFIFFMITNMNIKSYAEEDWYSYPIPRLGEAIETKTWKFSGTDLVLHGDIEVDENGNKTYVGLESDSIVEIGFRGTGFKLTGVSYEKQAAEYRIIIDDIVDETFEIYSEGTLQNSTVFEVNNLEDKRHRVRIIPVRYFGEEFGGEYENHYSFSIDEVYVKGFFVPVYQTPEIGDIEPNEDNNIVLNIEPHKETVKLDEEVLADLTINNIEKITAEDIRIKYDSTKLEYLGYEEVEGIKLIKDIKNNDEIRVILASQGEANIINQKETLLRLKFKAIASGKAIVDVTKGRVTDGIEMEKDLEDNECGEGSIIIEEQEGFIDVNNSGEFTLLDLGIDARYFGKDPSLQELEIYNIDIVLDGAIDDVDLLEIGNRMLQNGNYIPNNY